MQTPIIKQDQSAKWPVLKMITLFNRIAGYRYDIPKIVYTLNILFPSFYVDLKYIDFNWHYIFNYFFVSNDFVSGKDYFFTHGPLGFLLCPLDFGSNFALGIAVNFLIASIIPIAIIYKFILKEIKISRFVFFGFLFFGFSILSFGCQELIWMLASLVLSYLIIDEKQILKHVLLFLWK